MKHSIRQTLSTRDRRLGNRIEFPVFLNQYIDERRFRVLGTNLSETGMLVRRVHSKRAHERHVCALEIELPGASETIWARGEMSRQVDSELVCRSGIRFTAMARAHANLLRDYCIEARRSQLASLLRRIRR